MTERGKFPLILAARNRLVETQSFRKSLGMGGVGKMRIFRFLDGFSKNWTRVFDLYAVFFGRAG